ncbi:serotriflin-like [Tiliqua scincoides]|uniref:serotriflin-like n=1 Tax=Tiliqua scincoides TaxID=71010 RepID=UPI0034622AA3
MVGDMEKKKYTNLEMPLLLLLLSFGTLLHQSLGQTYTTVTHVPKKYQKEIIDKINAIRRNVQPTATNMLKMKWSDRAAESARKWAKQCKQVPSSDEMRTVDGTFCGEARLHSTYDISWSEIIDMWHADKSNFKYGVGAIDSTKDVYSYTQLIWYKTHEIGCAAAYCKNEDYKFFYVCRTCPAGNIKEQIATPYKKGPSCDDCPGHCEDKLCINPCNYKDKRKDCTDLLQLFNCVLSRMKKECKATCECKNNIM